MNIKSIWLALALTLAALVPHAAQAQSCTSSSVTDNFTGATSNCTWYYYGGACLTAGSTSYTATTSPGQLPMCKTLPYYGAQTQLGGNTGNANQDTPATGGALRLTNSADNQSGAIVSNVPFSLSNAGLQVTFTTETYIGDSGSNSHGGGSDGADGISFFLQDASAPSVTLGDYGGSLGYTCSNANNSSGQGYDGMIGAYIGLGIDEYGNFLDGSWVTTPATPTTAQTVIFNPSAQGANPQDNTATGYGKQANRVGLRGAGSVAWSALSTNPATSQYYPTALTGTAQAAAAVRQTCETGFVWDFSHVTSSTASGSATYTPANPGSGSQSIANPYNATAMPSLLVNDYTAIPNAYTILSHKIAVEGATMRGYATSATTGANYGIPITYNLTITPAGLLSMSYSYNGGNFQPVISGQNITASNGALPSQVRFGFAGSTGGSRNIHEIMCFQAQPQTSASSSAGLNQKQTAKVQTGTQVYFAFYNANNWTGSLTSQYLDSPDGNPNDLQIDPAVNWDAACVLTGLAAGATCLTTGQPNLAAENPDTGRVMLTWFNGTTPAGIPFTWSSTGATGLSASEQSNLNFDDPTASSTTFPSNANLRLEYLRGDRTHEQSATGVDPTMASPAPNPSGFRERTSVLGDIVDSSPTWVGQPSAPYPGAWTDLLHPSQTMPENSGPTYASFATTYSGRMNVVYAGANDGFMHGFRTGSFSGSTYVNTNNDGTEILAFMPAYVLNTINSSVVAGSSPAVPNTVNDYTNPLYAHRFNVDGTPGTGDLFYNGGWHTWLVGGLGAGGSSIFVLDITNPTNFSQGNAASIVIGEWSSSLQTTSVTNPVTSVVTTTVTGGTSTFVCAVTVSGGSSTACGNSLGKTYGTPQIRKFHNATGSGYPDTSWGAVFGNGGGSYNGDAGIYVMIANNTTAPTIYYLSTGVGSRSAGTPNGIYYVTPADLDGDHITDYVYAGDLQGNVWRFDLTSSNPANWAVTSASGTAMTTTGAGTPIFSTGSTSQPITTKVIVASIAGTGNPRVLVEFGTGQQTQFTNNAPAAYAGSQQYLMGVWDWNLSGWNSISGVQYDSLSSSTTPAAPAALSGTGSLLAQSVLATYDTNDVVSSTSTQIGSAYYYETISNNTISWADTSTTSTKQYGWYLPLSSGYGNSLDPNGLQATTTVPSAPKIYEQVIFNPTLQDGAFIVNTTIPPTTSLATCSSTSAGGWTMAINPATGGAFTNSFFGNSNHQFLNIGTQTVSGIALSGTGTPSVVIAGTNTYLVTQTVLGKGAISQINPPAGSQGSRLTWIEKR
ncbi:MAG TPA: PilC/PilY family type IV pilus protein [Steroidobacteraceae bacterium]|jgi:type IV pilus assembly protein PilY1|nr:PilC/PilY family type IV pilus protein [Steroidobacteraceae bacterium]